MDGDHPSFHSICHVRAAELFPKPSLEYEDSGVQIPFPPLSGEAVEALGLLSDGVIALSNFRLYVDLQDKSFHNIPLGAIEIVEGRENILFVLCKDCKTVRCSFSSNERCQDWQRRLSRATNAPDHIEALFAFSFHAWALEEDRKDVLQRLPRNHESFKFVDEVKRMNFDLEGPWRIATLNSEYKFCPSYPPYFLVPAAVNDASLVAISKFRGSRRIPAVVWRHTGNGAVIARSSQPEIGLLHWRSQEDEEFIAAIRQACARDSPVPPREDDPPKSVLIMDARSFSTAMANRARGGGFECHEYYQNCDIEFMNIPNIHTIRRGFQTLRQLLMSSSTNAAKWYSLVEGTCWYSCISGLLTAAVSVCNAVDKEGRPVLVHCSDGWDRTPQIVSLAQIMLDPYYRTFEGFQRLVEREWLDFGHKFGDRCGNSVNNNDINDRCPVFLQFLDCVHQILYKFPCSFQFNELFLVKLAQHTYSNLFGTFFGNSSMERTQMKVAERTFGVWSLFNDEIFENVLFSEATRVLRPQTDVKDLLFWNAMYVGAPGIVESVVVPFSEVEESDGSEELIALSLEDNDRLAYRSKASDRESRSKEHPVEKREIKTENITDSNILEEKACQSDEIEDSDIDLESSAKFTETPEPSGSMSRPSNRRASANTGTSQQKFDIDGLTSALDAVQLRVRQIIDEGRARELALQRDLHKARAALLQELNPPSTDDDDANSWPSDHNWVTVESISTTDWSCERDVSVCPKCTSPFWIDRARYYCRLCDNVFCADCFKNPGVIPINDRNYNFRICEECYKEICVSVAQIEALNKTT